MYIKNQRVSLFYKIIAIAVCISGQILTLGIPHGEFQAGQFLYYTNQSNILCLIYFICAARRIVKTDKFGESTFPPRIKGGVVLAITVTMIVFWGILSSSDFSMNAEDMPEDIDFEIDSLWPITNTVVHLIVPLLTIFDWLLFDPKGLFEKKDPIIWLSIPFIYFCFSLVVARTGYEFWSGSHYPYFFLDSDLLGLGVVILYIIGLGLGFLLLGYIIYGIDRLLGRKRSVGVR